MSNEEFQKTLNRYWKNKKQIREREKRENKLEEIPSLMAIGPLKRKKLGPDPNYFGPDPNHFGPNPNYFGQNPNFGPKFGQN